MPIRLHFLRNNPRLADPEVQLPDALIQPAMKGAGSCGEMADPIEEGDAGLCALFEQFLFMPPAGRLQ
jgi:hypothetical protein